MAEPTSHTVPAASRDVAMAGELPPVPKRTPPPPTERIPVLRWIKENLANSPLNVAVTVVCLVGLYFVVPASVEWGLLEAVFKAESYEDCRAANGACWAVVAEKHRPMFFGVYPFE